QTGRAGFDDNTPPGSPATGLSMPKIVTEVLIVLVSSGMVLAGLWVWVRTDAAIRWMPEFSEDSTPQQARWNARVAGVVFVVFGLVGLDLVLVEGLRPF